MLLRGPSLISGGIVNTMTATTTTNRFQMDLSTADMELINRLTTLAGLKTKKELLLNAVTLFKWAAQEAMYGRTVCTVSESDGKIRQLELPALSTIVEGSRQFSAEVAERSGNPLESSRPLSEILSRLKETNSDAPTPISAN